MTDLRKAAEMALSALECAAQHDVSDCADAIAALRAALAQPEQEQVGINGLTRAEEAATASVMGLSAAPTAAQEPPVAWMLRGPAETVFLAGAKPPVINNGWVPLYTHPAPAQSDTGICHDCGASSADGWALYCGRCIDGMRKPLTDEEIFKAAIATGVEGSDETVLEFARAIEAAHGIGEFDAGAQTEGGAKLGAKPVAWGMPNADGEIVDTISPAEHERVEGAYTVPLFTVTQK